MRDRTGINKKWLKQEEEEEEAAVLTYGESQETKVGSNFVKK